MSSWRPTQDRKIQKKKKAFQKNSRCLTDEKSSNGDGPGSGWDQRRLGMEILGIGQKWGLGRGQKATTGANWCEIRDAKNLRRERRKKHWECNSYMLNMLYITYILTQETSNKSLVAQRLVWVYVREEKVLFQQRKSNIHFFLDNMALYPPIRIRK